MSDKMKKLAEIHDKGGMLKLVESLPSHFLDAWKLAGAFIEELELGKEEHFNTAVVCGMGGSAIGADLAREVLGDRLDVPLFVSRDYKVTRAFLSNSFALISSYSGNTAETLSSYLRLKEAGVVMTAVTSGGKLEEMCRRDRVPVCKIPGGMPPRAAIAYSLVPILRLMDGMKLAGFGKEEFEEGMQVLEECVESYGLDAGGGEALELAEALHGKLPFVYASNGLLASVVRRWSCQFNENSKTLSHFAVFPELCHNEIVGWDNPKELTSRAVLILLEDEEDEPLTKKQVEIFTELVSPCADRVLRFRSRGRGRLARMLSIMVLGDFASVYLALLNEVDPTPVQRIDVLKKRLSGSS